MKPEFRIKKEINCFKCLRCDHEWIPRVNLEQLVGVIEIDPKICPHCKSLYWKSTKKKKS